MNDALVWATTFDARSLIVPVYAISWLGLMIFGNALREAKTKFGRAAAWIWFSIALWTCGIMFVAEHFPPAVLPKL